MKAGVCIRLDSSSPASIRIKTPCSAGDPRAAGGYNPLDFAASRRAMEPALKVRLIGAAVLILLALWIIPAFIIVAPTVADAPKQGAGPPVSLKIPAQPDAQLKSVTLTVG